MSISEVKAQGNFRGGSEVNTRCLEAPRSQLDLGTATVLERNKSRMAIWPNSSF